MKEKEEHSIDLMSQKSTVKGKTLAVKNNELSHKKIPSFISLIQQSADYELTEEYSSAYIDYVVHFTRYEHLNTLPSLEIAHLCTIIKDDLKFNRHPDTYKIYLDNIARLLVASDVNGEDDIRLYALVNEIFDYNPKYHYDDCISSQKNSLFFLLLKGLKLANNPIEKRSEYIINFLFSSIRSLMKKDDVFFSSLQEENSGVVLELIRCCISLNLFEKYKEDILSLSTIYLSSTRYTDLEKSTFEPDLFGMFKIGLFLIEQKDYKSFKDIINKYIDLESKHRCLFRACKCNEKQKLSALLYTLQSGDQIPEELKEICDYPFYKQIKKVTFSSNSLDYWTQCAAVDDKILHTIGTGIFVSSAIKNYSAKELIDYFSIITKLIPKPSNSERRIKWVEQQEQDRMKKQFNNKRNLISELIKNLNEKDLKSLDSKTKMELLRLYKWCNSYGLSIDLFNLLHNLTTEEQQELIDYYKVNFDITIKANDRFMTSEFILKAYPLEMSTTVDPISESKISVPAGLYMYSVTNDAVIPNSFGWGLLQMEKNPMNLPFEEVEPLLKRRSAVISVENELFYADLSLGKIRKFKSNKDNQKIVTKLSLKCTYDYQLADEEECKLIISLIGITPPIKEFQQLLQKKNQYLIEQGIEYNTVDYASFMVTNAVKLLNLYQFMNDDIFLFMKKMLSISPQNLERYFDNLVLIPAEYYPFLQSAHQKFRNEVTKGGSRSYEDFLILLGQQELILLDLKTNNKEFKFSKEDFIKRMTLVIEQVTSIKELTEFVTKEISARYKILLNLPENSEIDLTKFIKDPHLLSRLLTARRYMDKKRLSSVFDKLVEYDLRVDAQISDFVNDPDQAHLLGKKLSQHNQKIEKDLVEAKINTKQAFNYSIIKKFSTGDSDSIDLPSLAKALYADINNLQRILCSKNDVESKELNEIKNCIIHIKKQVEKKIGTIQLNSIQNGTLDKQINSINRYLEILLNSKQSAELEEHGTHFLKHREQLINGREQINWQLQQKKEKEDLAETYYTDIKKLELMLESQTPITFFKDKDIEQLKTIKSCIGEFKNKVEKKSGVIQLNAILNGTLNKHIFTIEYHLQKLSCLKLSNEVLDHAKKILAQLIKLYEIIRVPFVRIEEKRKEFEIKQWDKNQLETFLLGDYLSCCLAPDGGRFSALVQRRMDAAMMMHVIEDKELKQPVCGNWLFLAYDKEDPKDIYVVANFFEIRASYGLKKELSKTLVNELLAFTGQYAQSIGAKGFLIRPLAYGLIPDFDAQYDTTIMHIGKVGGFFDPNLINNQSGVAKSYYLDALNLKEFYVYKPVTCGKQIEINTITPSF